MHDSLEQQWASLLDQTTRIESLMIAYPDAWCEIRDTVGSAIRAERPDHLNELLLKADATARHWHGQVQAARGQAQRSRMLTKAIPPVVRSRMVHLALKKVLTTQIGADQPVRQSRADLWLCNHLIYHRYRRHQPVSAMAMRFLWPLIRNKPAAMAAAKRLGIYCFYSDRLIELMASRFAGRNVLEIAAGTGILSLLLSGRGVQSVATDDKSWSQTVRYGRHVQDLDAVSALRTMRPEVVICSWPPPGNTFEQAVFQTPTVRDYVVIGSRHQFATGARHAYDQQKAFTLTTVPYPEQLVLPKELDSEVLWFTRRS
jgi:hypothetical protein